jgi:two-component system, OmpR family, sensor kinase
MEETSSPRLSGPPLALQILGLLVGSLVVAQMVTLFLTLVLPPAPTPQYGLDAIARALQGDAQSAAGGSELQRILESGPPAPSGSGWLTSEDSRHKLATLLQRDDKDVQLYFYTPLPFAGVTRSSRVSAQALYARPDRQARLDRPRLPAGFLYADYQVVVGAPASSGGYPGGGFPGGFPGGGFPGAAAPGNVLPSVVVPGAVAPSVHMTPAPITQPAAVDPTSTSPNGPQTSLPQTAPTHSQGGTPLVDPQIPAVTPISNAVTPAVIAPSASLLMAPSARSANPLVGIPLPMIPDFAPVPLPKRDRSTPATSEATETRPTEASPMTKEAEQPSAAQESDVVPMTPRNKPSQSKASPQQPPKAEFPVYVPAPSRGLFGLAPAPFVQGDFIAALRLGNGQWAIVQPQPEPFPNSWQRRLILWFLLSFSLVAPIGWLFARRLVRPIAGFAYAAEQLGRDPTAPVLVLEGPAEVGRAASAFNRMQSRLRSFVDDRTAMVGAISHDLRTPLTRLRFRLEDVPDELREGMLAEVDEMEQMISSVLAFIRDASEPGARVKIDLSSIVEDVVEDAVFVGKPVTLETTERASVEVDPLGMRRLFGNLVENAVKYGDSAKIRLFKDDQDAVAEVSDNGPGLPEDELERVFQPFYRAPQARASNKHGTGLGLAVCRSIARAHGGDVQLIRGDHGLIAQLRLPLAYGVTGS